MTCRIKAVVFLNLSLPCTQFLLVFRRKDLCEGKHDARVEDVLPFGVFLGGRGTYWPFYLKQKRERETKWTFLF